MNKELLNYLPKILTAEAKHIDYLNKLSYLQSVAEPNINLFNDIEVSKSLLEYTEEFNKNSDEYMAEYLKTTAVAADGKFKIDTVFSEKGLVGPISRSSEGYLHVDAVHSICLDYTPNHYDHPIWVAILGFSGAHNLQDTYFIREKRVSRLKMTENVKKFNLPLPIVVQIQGPTYNQYDQTYPESNETREIANSIINSYKWERALLNISADWAQTENIPAIYVLPGELNRWVGMNNSIETSFKMRFNTTAERLGFRMQPNGLYGKDTSSFK